MYLPPDAICCRNDHNTFQKDYPCAEEISSLLPENMLRIIQNAVIASNTAIV